MELDLVGVGVAHLGDLLALRDVLPFLHQQLVVVGVDAERNVLLCLMTISLPKPRIPVPLKITRPGALA